MAIAKPLIYDAGWVIMNRQGDIIKSVNYLVQETFFVPNVFSTAYYCEKRPIYMEMYDNGELTAKSWEAIAQELEYDLQTVDISAAYNAAFDFKKAIPFTEQYIANLYSAGYNSWERKQYKICKAIVEGRSNATRDDFLEPAFEFRGNSYPIVDLWALACLKLINIDKYRDYCLRNGLLTASAQFFKTSAETAYQYLLHNYEFVEDHTALSDARIEAQILAKALKRGKVEPYMAGFPFKNLGTTLDYVRDKRPKYAPNVLSALDEYLEQNDGMSRAYDKNGYWTKMVSMRDSLMQIIEDEGE